MGSAVGYAVGYILDVKDKAGHQLTKRSPIDCLLDSRGVANQSSVRSAACIAAQAMPRSGKSEARRG